MHGRIASEFERLPAFSDEKAPSILAQRSKLNSLAHAAVTWMVDHELAPTIGFGSPRRAWTLTRRNYGSYRFRITAQHST